MTCSPDPATARAQLQAPAVPARAAEIAAHHRVPRVHPGIPEAEIDPLVPVWRAACRLDERVALAAGLRALGWAARLAADRAWCLQKAVGEWLRCLSRHAPDLARSWLAAHGGRLKPSVRAEAVRHLGSG